MVGAAEPGVVAAAEPVVPVMPLGSPIDEKLDRVSLVESPGHLDSGVEAAVPVDGKDDIFIGSTVEALKGVVVEEALKGDGVPISDVSDPIEVAESEKETSSESETSESEDSETVSSSSDESSSSSSEEDDVSTEVAEMDEKLDLEDGEIRGEDMIMWEDEDGDVPKGPIRSKHEIEDLPPVPQVVVCLEPHHQPLPVGVISSILGTRVIVEGFEKHNPLSEGSVLWVTETRSPLGFVDEIFGPVKSPYYAVRYNSEEEVPAGISMGTAVSFVVDFANHVLSEKDLYKKGYDASNENDEEATDEVEFSDDEKEAEYRRSLRQSKREADSSRRVKQEAAFDKRRTNFKGGSTIDTRHANRENATDKSRTNFKGPPSETGLLRNQEPAIDKSRTNFKVPPSNGGWHRNREPTSTNFNGLPCNDRWNGKQEFAIDKANFNGPNQRSMQLPFTSTVAAMGQPLPAVPLSLQTPTSVGFENVFGSNPPPIAATNSQSLQLSPCFTDPSQQLLLQQISALMATTLTTQQLQMIAQGGYPLNVLPSPQAGNTTYRPHNQNLVFNGFPNAMACQQQFVPNVGAVGDLQWLGGLLNLPFAHPTPGTAGQSNVGQAPFGGCGVHEQTASGSCDGPSYGQPSLAIDRSGIRPVQCNPSIPPSLIAEGRPNAGQTVFGSSNMQDPGASGSSNSHSYLNHWPPNNQGGTYPMQSNPPMGPTSLGAPFGCNNLLEQAVSGSGSTESSKQHQSTINHDGRHQPKQFNSSSLATSPGLMWQSSGSQAQFGCSNMQGQRASLPSSTPSFQQPEQTINQNGIHPPMHFNLSTVPTSLEQSPSSTDQDWTSSMQFNPGRSSFRGRNSNQRGRGGRRFFGRGGQPNNR